MEAMWVDSDRGSFTVNKDDNPFLWIHESFYKELTTRKA